jgi:hypothetical protein
MHYDDTQINVKKKPSFHSILRRLRGGSSRAATLTWSHRHLRLSLQGESYEIRIHPPYPLSSMRILWLSSGSPVEY